MNNLPDRSRGTHGTGSQLVGLIVVVVVIRSLAVSQHGRRSRERIGMPRVWVGIKEQSQAGEIVCPIRKGRVKALSKSLNGLSNLPTLPNTGPGLARSVVSHMAKPSPNNECPFPFT
jgi:hypothetical protein